MIKVLDQHTIDKIAAGEVIERPASVVKELVENSIDAGATRITVEITDGGTTLIRVTDNGSGIEADDVRKAYFSHATSKLDNVDDLLNIASLGFRGEALSTIAAVSQVEMITKTHEAMSGIKYEIHGGKEVEFKEIGAPDGTTIISRNLFFNTPARLKFLKTNMTEGSYINDLMSHIALANPDVAIKLISNGKVIIDTQGDGRLKETIYSLYGRDITKGLLEANYEDEQIKVTGYIGKPFLSKGNRSFENYFVNKRYIKNAVVNRAIEEAYKTYIMQHKFPYTALFIEVPTYMVDVNVHPAKREFRFDDEKALFHAVFHAVRDALDQKEMIPDAEVDYKPTQKIYEPVKKPEKVTYKPELTQIKAESVREESAQAKSIIEEKVHTESVHEVSVHENSKPYNAASSKKTDVRPDNSGNKNVNSFAILESLLPKDYRDKLKESSEEVKYEQAEMSEARYLSEEAKGHHKIIGQIFDTYWITEYDGVLYMMDQHAAHEKVNYERFLAEFKERKIHSQNIFPAMVINLSGREKQAVLENTNYLKETGFEVEDYGGNDVKLSALPANLIGLDGKEVFTELVAYLADEVTGLTEDIFIRKLASMGCKAAIKGNQRISEAEVSELIEKLMKLDNPYTCPHGRPTIIKMTKEEIDKKFKRIVE